MFRIFLFSAVLFGLFAAPTANAKDRLENRVVAESTAAAQAARLYGWLRDEGLMPRNAAPLQQTDFTNRADSAVGLCVNQCMGKFVDGYSLCRATLDRLLPVSASTVPAPTPAACGTAAMSGLHQCRKRCGPDSEGPVAELAN